MEKSQNFLTIKAFAEAAGRSQQTIYKQIGTRLAPYLHEIEGQKYIEHRALKEVFGIDVEQSVQPKDDNSFNRDEASEHPLYAILKEELAAKNRQIEQLQNQVSELTQANKELAQSINVDRKNELAGTMKELLPEGVLSEDHEAVVESVQEEISQENIQENIKPEKAPEEFLRSLSWREIIRMKFKKG